MKRRPTLLLPILLILPVLVSGCMTHAVHVEPISVAPVHVTMDVTLHVEDARATQGDEDEPATEERATEGAEGTAAPAAAPARPPTM